MLRIPDNLKKISVFAHKSLASRLSKVRSYLQPIWELLTIGQFKAAFFRKLGYSAENWEAFEQHLRELVLSRDVTGVEESRYGQKFIIEGPLPVPSGETVQIVSVWVILKGENVPRFVTAYPGGLR